MNISPDVLQVIQQSTITANAVRLPAQLERKLYEGVNKVLVAAGGRWNRKEQAHVFAKDPREILGLAVDSQKIVSEKQVFQAFYTPTELAKTIARNSSVRGNRVLEPSAGHGALADACKGVGARVVDCVELNPDAAAALRAKGYTVTQADFLTLEPDPLAHAYDLVVMNPPFTKNQDIAHVRHAIRFLRRGGRLVAIMGGNAERPWFRNELPEYSHSIQPLPENSFKSSGTDVNTILLTLHNPR